MHDYAINILLTNQGVNMGDHAQDTVRAVAPKPAETLESLIERTLVGGDHRWDEPEARRYLTIRIAKADDDA